MGVPRRANLWKSEKAHSYAPLPQTCFFSAATGKAFTIVLAGFAFTLVSLPNIILTPAFVAGFVRVLMRQRPGTVKIPAFLTSAVAMVTKLFTTSEQTFC